MSPRDRRLIRRLKRHDERAFREMVHTYQQPVFNFVYRMLGNRDEAEDLAQEVFVTVFKAIGSFRGESKLSTWIYRIATNHCHNRNRYLARRRRQSTQSFDELTERAVREGTGPFIALQGEISRPDVALEGRQLEEAIQRQIAALDQEHRLLVILRDIQGLSYQEIAFISGIPEGTVKSRLHRARMTLKDRLEGYL